MLLLPKQEISSYYNMRYNLGLMDKYPIEAAGSTIENNPMFRVFFKQVIDPVRLESAINKALMRYPLFKTRVMFDKEYYLETNDQPLVIFHSREEERPLVFGANSNDYPWQICYFENKMTFEWLHGVSDGVGASHFLRQILCEYFEVNNDEYNKFLVGTGLEPFFNSKEKGIDYQTEPAGFSFKEFKKIENRGYKTDNHMLRCPTSEILELAKVSESSIAPIVTILFSKAIRKHLPLEMKNKKVAANVVLDLRRPLNYETMHNCVEYKRITYTDEDDNASFKAVAKRYKQVLDHARLVPNVVRIITERVQTFKLYHILPNKRFLKACVKLVGLVLKDIDCNFVVTYLGRFNLPKEVEEMIDNVEFKVWHDFGECILACVDYNGMFNVSVSENFVEKGIVEDFIELSRKFGIHFEEVEKVEFEQAHFEE